MSSTDALLLVCVLLVLSGVVTLVMRNRRDGSTMSSIRTALASPVARRWGLAVAVVLGVFAVATGDYLTGVLSAVIIGGSVMLVVGRKAHA